MITKRGFLRVIFECSPIQLNGLCEDTLLTYAWDPLCLFLFVTYLYLVLFSCWSCWTRAHGHKSVQPGEPLHPNSSVTLRASRIRPGRGRAPSTDQFTYLHLFLRASYLWCRPAVSKEVFGLECNINTLKTENSKTFKRKWKPWWENNCI